MPPNPVAETNGTRTWTIRLKDVTAFEGDAFASRSAAGRALGAGGRWRSADAQLGRAQIR